MALTTTPSELTATALTLTTAAQPNITSVGTLTALTGGTGDLIWDTNTLVVDSSTDRVGMGTTSPSSLLHLDGTTNHTYLTVEANSGASAAIKFVSANTWTLGNDTASGVGDNNFALIDGSDIRLTVDASGNVGIGTASPTAALHIEVADNTEFLKATITGNEQWAFKGASGSGAMDYVSFGISGGTQAMAWQEDGNVVIGGSTVQGGGLLTLEGSDANMLVLHRTADTGDQGILFYDHGDHNATIYGKNGGALELRTNGNTLAMTIDSSQNTTFAGNVIGSDNLYLTTNTSDGSDNKYVGLDAGAGAGSTSRGAFLGVYGNEHSSLAGDVYVMAGVSGAIKFNTGSSATERMRITSGGVVLVGGVTNTNGGYTFKVGGSDNQGELALFSNATAADLLSYDRTNGHYNTLNIHASETNFTQGILKGPNGTVSAPTYGFTNDTDCGMFLSSTGYLGLTVAGTKSLEIGGGIIYTATNGKIRSAASAGSLELSGGGGEVGGQILLRGGAGDADIVLKTSSGSTSATERMRIRTDGNVGIGSTGGMPCHSSYYQLSLGAQAHFMAENTAGANRSLNISQNAHYDGDSSWETMETDKSSNYYQTQGMHVWRVSNGSDNAGTDISWVESLAITNWGQLRSSLLYNTTTGQGANVYVHTNGHIYRGGVSSRRYKNTILDATHGLSELLKLRSVTYKGNDDIMKDTVMGGLIAEEVHDAGLTEFVQYDAEDKPDALNYGNMVSLCIKAMQEQQTLIETLQTKVAALEAK